MQLVTIVEDYVAAALRHAVVEQYDNGMLAATVPGSGVVATGADPHECAADLYRRLEEWIYTALTQGWHVPVFDGIDLNADPERVLATYRAPRMEQTSHRQLFEDEQELEAEFDRVDQSLDRSI
jgi:hypothetical protein